MTKPKLAAVLLCLVLGLTYASCRGPSRSAIEEELEYWLGGDVPSDFRISERSYSFGMSDALNTAQIDFTPEGYEAFLRQIEPAFADTLRAGRQVHLVDSDSDRFMNFFLLGVTDSSEQVLRIQFGHE